MDREPPGRILARITHLVKDSLQSSEKRILIYIACGFLIVAVMMGVFVAKRNGARSAAGAVSEKDKNAAQSLTYLPDTKRDKGGQGVADLTFREPFAGAVVLKGILTGGGGKDLAIIEAGQTSYIVGKGDRVAGNWVVASISADAVVLTSGGQELRLEFNGRQRKTVTSGDAGGAGNAKPAGDKAGTDGGNQAN
ncbi:MAG: hypothetical protein K6T80_03175 [Firmicutes bacterium]|nr:hypothetical protein [Bacillota bacterium]